MAFPSSFNRPVKLNIVEQVEQHKLLGMITLSPEEQL
jgi:hypothetical protein